MTNRASSAVPDRHILYEAAVQGVGSDIGFFLRVYRRKRGNRFRILREDFCGTAALACEWARRSSANEAWGIDNHRPTLAWAERERLPLLGEAGERVHLVCDDVRRAAVPAADVTAALNFSYWLFEERAAMREYFESARAALRPDGLFILDAFGGTEAMDAIEEQRIVTDGTTPDGSPVPKFTYIWEQAAFNPINHHMRCAIHFKLRDGRLLKNAFTYEWRFWTLPELRELLLEAGFVDVEVYVDTWDDASGDGDGAYRLRKSFETQAGWLAYIVAIA